MANTPPNPMLVLVLASLLGGGGVSVLAPKVAPGWYRDDPAYGHQLRKVEGDVAELRADFHEFLREGPREVRANQTRILSKLTAIEKRLDVLERGQ